MTREISIEMRAKMRSLYFFFFQQKRLAHGVYTVVEYMAQPLSLVLPPLSGKHKNKHPFLAQEGHRWLFLYSLSREWETSLWGERKEMRCRTFCVLGSLYLSLRFGTVKLCTSFRLFHCFFHPHITNMPFAFENAFFSSGQTNSLYSRA